MPESWLLILSFAGAIGSGLMAGVFFAFSSFVMRGLALVQPPAGVAAMQSINIAVINPLFLGAFLGTALLGVASIVLAFFRWGSPAAGWMLAGGLSYVVGTFLVTLMFNVPLNDSLAKLNPQDADAARQWAIYLRSWSAWNHVRTIGSLASLVSFVLAFRRVMVG